MKITREDVLRVAELAHLGLTGEEVEACQRELDAILTYVDRLNELDVSGVEPMAQVLHGASAGAGTPAEGQPELREDVRRTCDVAAAVLAQAPDADVRFFRVPKVIDK